MDIGTLCLLEHDRRRISIDSYSKALLGASRSYFIDCHGAMDNRVRSALGALINFGHVRAMQVELRRLSLYFYSCPFFQKQEYSGVIQIGVTVFDGYVVDFFDCLEPRQLHARFLRRLKCQADVFAHQA